LGKEGINGIKEGTSSVKIGARGESSLLLPDELGVGLSLGIGTIAGLRYRLRA
jgi:hypothetical protein